MKFGLKALFLSTIILVIPLLHEKCELNVSRGFVYNFEQLTISLLLNKILYIGLLIFKCNFCQKSMQVNQSAVGYWQYRSLALQIPKRLLYSIIPIVQLHI